ncbi:hypothetical protein ASPBRDRAFT_539397 [Aspergillus brasiliensis CBS 101740]|uniref:WW domain-containing protein n=1 Tax=Aspergillus brasiliensis (strain CBS 101740 / IMI 381727 / IBT 21946) TaxID=767769 RepID=A0A1L9UL99_ASPBC|nr:hypothetical protein ASPBRDRAFT_539397 [Aspergillus brasiliensis CBS 101740]
MSANPSTDDSPSAAGSPPQVPEIRESQHEESPTAEEKTPGPEPTEREETEQKSEGELEGESSDAHPQEATESESAPPLPDEVPPPLPSEAPPGDKDDGWEPVWDPNAQAYYFYNRFTGVSQWENPRVPDAAAKADDNTAAGDADAAGPSSSAAAAAAPAAVVGGYNPAIHGDYDPTAPYAQQYEHHNQDAAGGGALDPEQAYEAVGAFNRFTGRWQAASQNTEYHNDENKSRRQMYAFFDVDAAANTHDGRSLRAERSAKKLSKKELKMFKEKRREKKEEKRRAWLRD